MLDACVFAIKSPGNNKLAPSLNLFGVGLYCCDVLQSRRNSNIAPDEEFKRDIGWIRKDAERKVLGALVKFHDRRVERSKSKLVKPEQESRKEKRKDMSDKVPANTLEFSHEQKLENIQKKIDELNKMKHVLQNAKENKQSESYPRVFSENIDYQKGKEERKSGHCQPKNVMNGGEK